jgi:glycosyltransferase involved in cell wall biosynthesis
MEDLDIYPLPPMKLKHEGVVSSVVSKGQKPLRSRDPWRFESGALKIAIDFTSARSGGGIAYARGLLKGLAQAGATEEFLLFVCNDQPQLRLDLPVNFQYRSPAIPSNHLAFRAVWQQAVLPAELARWRADVVYVPTELVPMRTPVPSVCLFQNWLPFLEDEAFLAMGFPRRSLLKLKAQNILARTAARRARTVLFVSSASRDAVCNSLGLSHSKTAVVHHGGDGLTSEATGTSGPDLPRPYILVVADLLPHKNLRALAHAVTALLKGANLPHHLVLVGRPWYPRIATEVRNTFRDSGLGGRLHLVGGASPEILSTIYRSASLLVMPSYVETFGLPVIEAMAYGVPVAASLLSAAPEVCGDAAVCFDPWSADGMGAAIGRVLRDPAFAEEMGRKGKERVRELTWEKAARETLRHLREAAGG